MNIIFIPESITDTMQVILALIGVIALIILTSFTEKSNRRNSDFQINAQKKILISQLRKSEIDRLEDILSLPLSKVIEENKEHLIHSYIRINEYLSAFWESKHSLFPTVIYDDKTTKTKNMYIKNNSEIYKILRDWKSGEYSKESKIEYNNLVLNNIKIKNELISTFSYTLIRDLK